MQERDCQVLQAALDINLPTGGKEKTERPSLSSSFAINFMQYFMGWSKKQPRTDTKTNKTEDSHWVIFPMFSPLLKWKCCECEYINEAVEGEDEDALFCEGDYSRFGEFKLDDSDDKLDICGHGRCEDCEALVGGGI